MKIIFLDIDGVLNSKGNIPLQEEVKYICGGLIEIPLLKKLQSFVKEHNIGIVGISSWFIDYDYKEIRENLMLPILDKSYSCEYKRDIGAEKWIKENAPNAQYCFVDDCELFFENRNHPKLIKINQMTGLQDSDLEKIKEHLEI